MAGIKTSLSSFQQIAPEILYFNDDGVIPNSRYPLLVYRNAFQQRDYNGASWLENKFAENNWSNSWRNGIFTFQHYHSIAHEVLGIYSGTALVLLGGDKGKKVTVKAGDIIVIPAGVGHKNLGSENLGVVGAYPNGMPVDIMKGEPGERPVVDQNIAAVPFPVTDPLFGKQEGLLKLWSK
ncbi:MAG: cupin [Chitinophagaceae bacterium]|nr:cupin [Chitinophagaceae bacterium]